MIDVNLVCIAVFIVNRVPIRWPNMGLWRPTVEDYIHEVSGRTLSRIPSQSGSCSVP